MTWKSHKAITFCFSIVLGFDLLSAIIIAAFSVLPDAIEGITGSKHRGFSHDPILWGSLLVLAIFLPLPLLPPEMINQVKGIGLPSFLLPSAIPNVALIPLGALFHILEDALTPSGVPLLKWRFRIPLIRTGSPSEYLLTFIIIFGVAFFLRTSF